MKFVETSGSKITFFIRKYSVSILMYPNGSYTETNLTVLDSSKMLFLTVICREDYLQYGGIEMNQSKLRSNNVFSNMVDNSNIFM